MPSDAEIAAAQRLFDRIVEAEAGSLTEEQKAAPREYLVAVWREAAATVMRPLPVRQPGQNGRPFQDPFDLADDVPF